MTSPRRAGRAWRRAVLSGLAGAALAGCGQPEGPRPPQATSRAERRPASSATALDASVARVDEPDLADAEAPDASAERAALYADSSEGGLDGAAVCSFAPCAPGAPCPDLVIDVDDLRASTVIDTRTFAPTDCAVLEGCIAQTGTRRLLRFNTATANLGTGDLVVGSPTASACFEFSQCHQHYHFVGFSRYTLYEPDGTSVAATGHKQSFCLEDVGPYAAAPAPDPVTPFTCNNQGLHVGWEDIYPSDIDCQWVDITGVPAGNYLLTVAVNTAGQLPESDYTNDTATVPVTIPSP